MHTRTHVCTHPTNPHTTHKHTHTQMIPMVTKNVLDTTRSRQRVWVIFTSLYILSIIAWEAAKHAT